MGTRGQAPKEYSWTVNLDAVALDADKDTTVFVAPEDLDISSVEFISSVDYTGADTDTRTLILVNKGTGGAGTDVIATLLLDSGTDADAFEELAIPVTGARVAAGDVIVFESNSTGTGILQDTAQLLVKATRADQASAA